ADLARHWRRHRNHRGTTGKGSSKIANKCPCAAGWHTRTASLPPPRPRACRFDSRRRSRARSRAGRATAERRSPPLRRRSRPLSPWRAPSGITFARVIRAIARIFDLYWRVEQPWAATLDGGKAQREAGDNSPRPPGRSLPMITRRADTRRWRLQGFESHSTRARAEVGPLRRACTRSTCTPEEVPPPRARKGIADSVDPAPPATVTQV